MKTILRHSSRWSWRYLSLTILLGVNFVFALKYLERVTPYYLALSVGVTAAYFLVWRNRRVFNGVFDRKVSPFLLLLLWGVMATLIFYQIPKETLHVDRWSIISSFWETAEQGNYAYAAKSFDGNHPGALPFYFYLAYPFYVLGETGWFSFLGLVSFVLMARWQRLPGSITAIVLCGLGLFYLWELACRSNLFTVSTLALGAILLFQNRYNGSVLHSFWFGVLFGLVFSTRNILVLPLCVVGASFLARKKLRWSDLMGMGVSAAITIVVTFLPVVWGHWSEFIQLNPFSVQSDLLLPWWSGPIFILLAFVAGYFCRTNRSVYLMSALTLLWVVVVYVLLFVCAHGWSDAFFESYADISYFIFAVPFAIWHLFAEEPEDVVLTAYK